MTFHDFVAQLKEEVALFEVGYEEQHRQNPDMFPLEMGHWDWFEQFILWRYPSDN